MTEIPELEIKDKNESPLRSMATMLGKSVTAAVTLISEIAVIAVIGSMVGAYYTNKTVVSDCQQVNLAKVGNVYIKCTVVEPVKDAATQPPR